jgi:hypothetical protein
VQNRYSIVWNADEREWQILLGETVVVSTPMIEHARKRYMQMEYGNSPVNRYSSLLAVEDEARALHELLFGSDLPWSLWAHENIWTLTGPAWHSMSAGQQYKVNDVIEARPDRWQIIRRDDLFTILQRAAA